MLFEFINLEQLNVLNKPNDHIPCVWFTNIGRENYKEL